MFQCISPARRICSYAEARDLVAGIISVERGILWPHVLGPRGSATLPRRKRPAWKGGAPPCLCRSCGSLTRSSLAIRFPISTLLPAYAKRVGVWKKMCERGFLSPCMKIRTKHCGPDWPPSECKVSLKFLNRFDVHNRPGYTPILLVSLYWGQFGALPQTPLRKIGRLQGPGSS